MKKINKEHGIFTSWTWCAGCLVLWGPLIPIFMLKKKVTSSGVHQQKESDFRPKMRTCEITQSKEVQILWTINNNNNNNKAFKSQISWGRLELKSSRSNQGSGTGIAVFQALISKAKSLGILYHFKSSFIASTQVNFGLLLPLFTLLSWLRIPLRTGAFGGLRWTCPSHLNQCWTSFSSINSTPNLSCISSFQTRSLLVWLQIQRNIRISATLIVEHVIFS